MYHNLREGAVFMQYSVVRLLLSRLSQNDDGAAEKFLTGNEWMLRLVMAFFVALPANEKLIFSLL